ncbi:MAG: glycine C-acetyltransferase [Dysgonamonadaceae bacterium]|jgi:glycine C-acetyltransferase|nr:glycine C-acetyltransferase [Dysgonamonadaceae bacterium]
MYHDYKTYLTKEIAEIKTANLWKCEREISSPQSVTVNVNGRQMLNFCANNYLGLSNDTRLINTAKQTLDERGYGMSSVRFICGTQDVHKNLEKAISTFFGTEDTILYGSCYDANGGLFEPLLSEQDAIVSDALNHASIIDGIRLSKAQKFIYRHADMKDLEQKLEEASKYRFVTIATDAVFSMDGDVAPLNEIYALSKKYGAMIMLDESHSAGVVGKTGHGLTEYFNLKNKIEIITGTLGKSFGGAIGGFTSAKQEIVDILRQRSRPYLFSNSIPPSVAAASVEAFKLADNDASLHDKLHENTQYFIAEMKSAGFEIKPTQSAICAVMLYDAQLSQNMATELIKEGIYVAGFYYPVVPKGEARIRVQISAAHRKEHLDQCILAFTKTGRKLGILK